MEKLSKAEQDELIAEEIERWAGIFSELSDEKKAAASRLIERVAFMTVTLSILEEDVKEKGPTYLFINGSQEMYVENPSQKSYNTMINRYTAACDKLFNLLPKEVVDDAKEKTKRTGNDLI